MEKNIIKKSNKDLCYVYGGDEANCYCESSANTFEIFIKDNKIFFICVKCENVYEAEKKNFKEVQDE